ncbi:gliding motility-associated C-terminal domain-containing protein [Chitinophaga horti]|uniref:Gliding motility-associated C-terminal domain-containing protein n=1 Tax=Chitinophaga horti TaxID=2920382 RepID=A0ABY6J681_9BACT|nr:gliding motility-associated C-terminal domain-containing protein [Chitinophaga horti]UYQ95190.1 gliding motility-associated C-terminal domain-containing protein [Chitinophaga horti]
MRKFLLLLTLLACTFVIGKAQNNARLTAPRDVCKGNFVSMHAFYFNNNTINRVEWRITPLGRPMYTITPSSTVGVNGLRYISSGRGQSVTLDFLEDVASYTVQVRIFNNSGTTSFTDTDPVTIRLQNCEITECKGSFQSSSNFKETFGTFGVNEGRRCIPNPPSGPPIIQYNCNTSSSLADNDYNIYWETNGGGRPEWVASTDHTGDTRGGMLICNSSHQPNTFYRREITGLCPGAVYNFTAWFQNLDGRNIMEGTCRNDYIYTGVTFKIYRPSDLVNPIASFPTYAVSANFENNAARRWMQFGGSIRLAPGQENLILTIENNFPGGCGNDIAIDDISFEYCAPKIFSYIDGLKTDRDAICQGAPIRLTSEIDPINYFQDPLYQWQRYNAGTATWQPVAGAGFTGINTETLNIAANVLTTVGVERFRLMIYERGNENAANCYTPGNSVELTILEKPVIAFSTPFICLGQRATLTVNPGTYDIYNFTGPNLIPLGGPNYNRIDAQPTTTSQYIVEAVANYGNGKTCSAYDTSTLVVDTMPRLNLGPDVAVCVGNSITLDMGAANSIFYTQWTGTGISTTLGQTLTISPSPAGNYTYTALVRNNACTITDNITISALNPPTARISTASQSLCNVTDLAIAATSNPPSNQRGTWTIVGAAHGAYIESPNAYSTRVRSLPVGETITVRWTVSYTAIAGCESYDQITIRNVARPQTANAGPSQTVCGQNSITMAANAPLPNEYGTWSSATPGVSFSNVNDPNAVMTYSGALPRTLISTTWSLRDTSNICPASTSTVQHNLLAAPTLTVLEARDTCATTGLFRLLFSTAGNPNRYSITASGANPMPGFTDIVNQTLSSSSSQLLLSYPNTVDSGTYTFSMTVTQAAGSNAACTSTRDFTLRLVKPSRLDSISPSSTTICNGSSATLIAYGYKSPGAVWRWYTSSCNGTLVHTGDTLTVSPTSTVTYYVRAEAGTACPATTCLTTTINVDPMPARPNAGPDQTLCNVVSFNTAATYTGGATSGIWSQVPGGTAVFANPNANITQVTGIAAGSSATLIWSVRRGVCVSLPDTVVFRNLAPITNNVIGPNQTICLGSPAAMIDMPNGLPAGGNGSNVYSWASAPTATGTWTTISGANGATYTPGALANTTYFRRTIAAGCPSVSNVIAVRVARNAPVLVSTPAAVTVDCVNGTDYTTNFGTPVFSHPDNIPVTITQSDVTTTVGCGSRITRTWRATDSCGRFVETSQIVNVQDTTRPVFSTPAPANAIVNCDAIPTQPDLTATDNCSTVTVDKRERTRTIAGATCAANYEIIRTWIATDLCGNRDSVVQVLTVQDTTRPTFTGTAPADTVVQCGAIPAQPTIGAQDNCTPAGSVTVTMRERIEPAPGSTCVNNYLLVRTWIARDLCGNSDSLVQRLTVIDTVRPVFTTAAPLNVTVNCDAIPTQPTLQATDNCSAQNNVNVVPTQRREDIPGACVNNYRLIRVWTATDECGNVDSVRQIITVQDTTRPTFTSTVPADTIVNCHAPLPVQPTMTATDNCSAGNVVVTPTQRREDIAGACVNNYRIIRVWTARDECGNVDSVRQIITVQDTTRPTFTSTVPADTTVDCHVPLPVQPTMTATDNCSAGNVVVTPSQRREDIAGACVNNYRIIRVWTARDECGNIDSVRQIITVQDTTRPTFTSTVPADTTVDCHVPLPVQPTLNATDNCSAGNVVVTPSQRREDIAGACVNNYRIIRVWTAVDECGNIDSVRQVITVQDTTRPTFTSTIPADTTVDCHVPLPVQPTLNATDNCSAGNVVVTPSQRREDIAGACVNNYRIIRVWTAVDECGNIDSVRQIITVQDTTRPTFTSIVPADTTVDCHIPLPVQPTLNATDNCSAGNVVVTPSQRREDIAGACANNYRIIRVWTAVDECGNIDSVRQIITVQDTTRPTFTSTVPADTTVDCHIPLPVQPTLNATDNCSTGTNVTVTPSERREDIAGACANNYRIIRVWTVRDECGNIDSVRQIITVQDTTRPTFTSTIPADTTVDCHVPLPVQPTMTATDNCSAGNVVVTPSQRREDIAGACVNNYRIIRVWTARDECGNIDSVRQIITVQDTTRPTFTSTVPADTTVDCHVPLPVQPTLNATDNCSAGNVVVTPSQRREDIAGACVNNYRIIRVWTAVDECGNIDSVRQVITVQDTTRPTFTSTVPADTTVDCHIPLPVQPTLNATDNCSAGNVVVTPSQRREDIAGACVNNYRIIRVWTAVDECGNIDSVRQIITVQDTTRPTFTSIVPADTTVDCHIPLPVQPTLNATDNCSAGNVVVTPSQRREDIAGACANNYRIIRVWTAVDECGNIDSVRQIITVQDTTRPTFTSIVPADTTIDCNVPLPVQPTLNATDNCSAGNVVVTPSQRREDIAGACANNYRIIRVWTVRDECGNIDSVRQIITVQDTTRPTFTSTVPADTTVDCHVPLPVQPTLNATDNCSTGTNVTVTPSQRREDIAGACANNYRIIRVWTAVDECGNIDSVRQVITVQDTTRPTFTSTTPADTTVDCHVSLPVQPTLNATDNCSAGNVVVTPSQRREDIAGACVNNYRIIRVWTAVDECGNIDSVRQVITVQDTTRPTFTSTTPADTTVDCHVSLPVQPTLNATDNCSTGTNVTVTPSERREDIAGACANNYRIIRVWTAVDECGNIDSVRQIITVQDTTRPTFTSTVPADTTVDCHIPLPVQPTLNATDNCSAGNVVVTPSQRREDIAGACVNNYRIIRVWTAVDECGNIDSVRQIITVQDTTRPTFTSTVPADTTVDCHIPLPVQPTLNATDNCSTGTNVTVTPGERREDIAGACANNYRIIRVWTVRDECGNIDSVRQIITVQDTTRPTFTSTIPADTTVDCHVPLPVQPTLNATDNCSAGTNVTVTPSQRREDIAGACANNYRIIRVWTAVDECGNIDSVRQIITVQDTTRPTFTSTVPADTTVDCHVPLPVQPTLTATDNCSAGNVVVTPSQRREDITGACVNNYRIIRVWTAVDECGNIDSVRQVITVQDTTRPTFTSTVPADTTVDCHVPLPVQPTLNATDNCSAGNVVVTPSQHREDIAGACVNNYRIIRVWTAVDECGNIDSVRQVITVQDTTRPTFTSTVPADTTVDCHIPLPVQPTLNATDNCSAGNVVVTPSQRREDIAGACVNNYRIIRVWTAVDECGNIDSVRQVITVQDTTRPTFTSTVPADTTVDCHIPLPVQPTLNATDNCSTGTNVTVTPGERREDIAGACANNYRIIRVWTVRDECGNIDSVRQVITVQDTTRPTFTSTVPADTTVDCHVPLPVQPTLNATDNCSTGTNVTVTPSERREDIAGACANNYRIIRVWTVRDECGNIDSVRQIITVQDTTRPTFTSTIPADTTVDCHVPLPVQPTLNATDNCSTGTNVTVTPSERREDIAGACVNNYRIIRVWTAVDECGNIDSVRQIITVQDTTRPTFTSTVPADTTVDCHVPLPVQPTLNATDNCSAGNVVVTPSQRREDIAGACVNNYRIIRVWTAVDECGNIDSVRQIITVQDTTRPTFTSTIPADTTVDCHIPLPVQPTLNATDNCSSGNVVVTPSERREDIAGACANNYRIIRVWTAVDECGNIDSVRQIITVQDTTRPTFTSTVPADTTVDCHVPLPVQPTLNATDNCSAGNVVVTPSQRREDIAGACANNYRIIRVWTAVDECGNIDSVRQIITVQDTTRPTFTSTVPADTTVDCHIPLPVQPTLNATDNCSTGTNVTVTPSERREDIAGACANNYRIIRVWTVRDECGNVDSVRQIITVQDTTRPTFTSTVPADTTVDCHVPLPVQPTLNATDNCSTGTNVTVTPSERREDIAGACVNNYRIIRVWTAVDECGNIDSVRQIITVQDTTRPTFTSTTPADTTVDCHVSLPVQPTLNATDNCSTGTNVTVTPSERREDIAGACANNYRIIRVWTAVDECGNVDSVRQIITVQDTTRPTFTSTTPADTTVDCHIPLPVQPTLNATDNCSAGNVVVTPSQRREDIAGACVNNYRIIRVWTAIDECGNIDSVRQIITVQDTTRPTFTSTVPADTTVDCHIPLPVQPMLNATDNCSAGNVVVTPSQRREDIAGACANNYRIIRVWTAVDECGNIDSVRQVITVQDTTRPTFTSTVPADTTVDCHIPLPVQPTLNATDNCSTGTNVTVTPSERREDIAGACANNYRIIRVWTAVDECGNVDSVRQIITVQDTTRPTFTSTVPADTTVDCHVPLPVQPTLNATDNCSTGTNVTVTPSERREDIPGACANNYRIIRVWIARDECGNIDSVRQIITVQDTTRPTFNITVPADTTVDCHATLVAQPTLTATDNCSVGANVIVTPREYRESIPGACAGNYRIIRVWTATDECGNVDSVRQIITVQDTIRPVFTAPTPANTTVSCDNVPVQPDLAATDNCSPNVTIVKDERITPIPGRCENNYLIVRTWTAIDECNNTTTITQTITVIDTTRPVFTVAIPADTTVDCHAVPAQRMLPATDNCSPDKVTVTMTEQRIDQPGACVNNYQLIRRWTATDVCGNVATAMQTITVQDTTRPVFSAPAPPDATVACDAVPAQPDLTATDLCSPTGVTITKAEQRIDIPGACVNNYQLVRTWTATDACGNSIVVSQTLTVQDITRPTFAVAIPRDTTVNCHTIPAMPQLTATDNCSPAANITITMNQQRVDNVGACESSYRLLRTWTATDECGNFTTALQIVTVQDTTKPVFTMPIPANVTVNCGEVPAQPDLTATDNCTPANRVTIVKDEQREEISNTRCAGNYRLIRTWTALDQCGNVTVARQIITVQDTSRPVFTSPIMRDTTVNCHEVPTWPVVTASDNCNPNGVTITTSQTKQFLSATCSNNYRLIRQWTARDECGNTAIMQQIITVEDTTRPTFSIVAPRDTTVNCNAVPSIPTVTATDNCSVNSRVRVTQTQIRENIPNSCNYRLVRTWTATDECGNVSTIRQVITVQDTTRPVIAAAPASMTLSCQQPVPAAVTLRATDNCDASFPKNAVMTTDPFVADNCNGYTITRRWNVVDACGNRAEERVQIITVLPCPKPVLKPELPRNCSTDPFFTIETVSPVTNPTYILVGVTPSNAVRTPLSQTSNRFNLNGATSASFIVRDGRTGCASDTVTYQLNYIQTPVVNLGRDTSICGGDGLVLDAGAANYNNAIVWSTGATTQRIRVSQAGTYWVQVSNGICVTRDIVRVAMIPMPLVDLPDTTICRGQSVRLNATVAGATYLWSTGATTPSINVSTQERFWVRVMKNGCITIDTVNVTVNPPPDITLRSDTTICQGQSVVLSVTANASRIQWITGETGSSIVVNKAGNYWVSVTRDRCVVRDTVTVRMRAPIKFDLGPDRIMCPDGRFTIDARMDDAASYLWNDGDRNPIKSIDRAGTYVLSIMDRYCYDVKSDSLKVRIAGAPKVSLGNDTMICRGLTYTIRPRLLEDATHIRWSNGTTGPTLNVTEPGTYTVTAYNDCGSTTDEIVVDFMECESKPDIPNAFSPNGDGRNDIFRPVVRGPMYDYELRIFNRWGEMVFISKDLHKGWDGTQKGQPVDNSTFVWWMSYKKVQNGPVFILKGEVTVIR